MNWPEAFTEDRAMAAMGTAATLTPDHICAWVAQRIGATQTKEESARWFAVRDALSLALNADDDLTFHPLGEPCT